MLLWLCGYASKPVLFTVWVRLTLNFKCYIKTFIHFTAKDLKDLVSFVISVTVLRIYYLSVLLPSPEYSSKLLW